MKVNMPSFDVRSRFTYNTRSLGPWQGVPQLSICLSEEPEDHIKAAAAWALGQLGRHTPEHARAVAVTNTLPVLLSLYMAPESSEDLQVKVSV